jgi:Trk K+ transport system NAD-binding subunit
MISIDEFQIVQKIITRKTKARFKKHDINCIYGDILEDTILDKIKLNHAKIIISTIPYFKDNLSLINYIKISKESKNTLIFVVAQHPENAIALRDAGADYIIMPNYVSGNRIGEIIQKLYSNKKNNNKRQYNRYSQDKWDKEKSLIKFILEENDKKMKNFVNYEL